MLKNWQSVQRLMGSSEESLKAVPQQLRDTLTVLSPEEVEEMISGLPVVMPVKFYRAFMIAGWYAFRRTAKPKIQLRQAVSRFVPGRL